MQQHVDFLRTIGAALAVFISSCGVNAQAVYVPSVYKSSFGDGLKVEKYKTGYYNTYQDADNYAGVEYGQHVFETGDWLARGEQLAYVSKAHPANAATHSMMLGYNTLQGGRTTWVTDATYSRPIHGGTTAEISFNRDRVEVQQSLMTHVMANTYGLSVERKLLEPLTVQVAKTEAKYTDGNHRQLSKTKATYEAWPEYGLSLQMRARYFRNSDTSVNSGYFNPYRFVESMGAIDFNKTYKGWVLGANIGYGRQAGGDDPKTLAKAFEFSATTPPASHVFVRAKAGYFRSLGYGGSDFIYRYVSEDVVIQF